MSDADIIVILIHFHSGGFRCFKHYYLHYICKYCKHLLPRTGSYNRFVELEKEVLLQLAVFIKQVLLGECTGWCTILYQSQEKYEELAYEYCRQDLFKKTCAHRDGK